jgi:hypothetical protein
MDTVSVPETLNALRLAVNTAESKIRNYVSCTANREAVEVVMNETTEPTASGRSRPIVAKYLRSKSDDRTFKQNDAKIDVKKLELDGQNDSKIFGAAPLPRAVGLPHKQKTGDGFVPAWRRKSLDDINRRKHERKGELNFLAFDISALHLTFSSDFFQRRLEYPTCRYRIQFKPGHPDTTIMRQQS